ncbi:hypothetical protein H7I87_26235 [Mycobacterium timonense]|uniref:Uncharacterized protein n=1 Tax=Mycobacterium bouchedurhonense TaxID=701041 RepID=A0AAW5S7B5_MYCBC|nr:MULTISPECIES: hypothetical protein [Mycobacterium avium complex (MAC)]KDO99012.1 hypothetical protein MAV3388_13150 [Mycobacterium avium subsp. hominissuis 3388]MBZ4613740.1 hypothetical protein [Mycobacterium avium subsp. hominissuis]MCV6990845.1 hypothetical protein [Mycobacterium bouchedurhonense]MCV6998150.1 hypothetical protein [Mycobacterium timonense]ORA46615.1 hypothetical protein BST19_18940 [Mycobacterium bouchedurhonense]
MGFEFKIDTEALKQFEQDLQKRFDGKRISIPLEGSEEDAVRDVRKQLVDMGLTPNDAEIAGYVRDARRQMDSHLRRAPKPPAPSI